jgi:hypothetical protein
MPRTDEVDREDELHGKAYRRSRAIRERNFKVRGIVIAVVFVIIVITICLLSKGIS